MYTPARRNRSTSSKVRSHSWSGISGLSPQLACLRTSRLGVSTRSKNESDKPARMIITVAPSGLEKMFMEVGHPVESGATQAPMPTKADIDKLLAIAPNYGIEIRVPHH